MIAFYVTIPGNNPIMLFYDTNIKLWYVLRMVLIKSRFLFFGCAPPY